MFAGIFVANTYNYLLLIYLYQLFIFLYSVAIRLVSHWNKKAKEWIDGRINVIEKLEENISSHDRVIWVHASSAGEFEQAKPVIEKLRQDYWAYKIVISFFSPSGYKTAQHYLYADYITYLPLDTLNNASRFINALHPTLVLFVKYDFWYYHLKAIREKNIPLLLISSVFRKEQAFFKFYGSFYKRMLLFFTHIFVQDKQSLRILQQHKITSGSISGDTRFDRVTAITKSFTDIPFIQNFINGSPVLVAGSTWEDDEVLLAQYYKSANNCKLIIAPHEITAGNISGLQRLFEPAILYSEYKLIADKNAVRARVLIIDNVGMLSRLYKYAHICYVGGGFTKDGVHNILEAAVYGKPVLYGPAYKKYREAVELIAAGGAFSVASANELKTFMENLWNNPESYTAAAIAANLYVHNNTGATQTIVNYIQENRLLTK